MKLIHLLVVVAFLAISASVALADGVDPIVFTKGCGGTGQPACDAVVLTPGNTTGVMVSEAFTCDMSGNCTATDTVINLSGLAINSFSLVFQDSLPTMPPTPLSYSCMADGFFVCSPVPGTTNAFTFAGASICADADSDFVDGTFVPDGDECGVVIGLNATTAEGISGTTTLTGTASFSAPEPSSALLLLFGLVAGLVSFKSRRSILA